jgi:IS5 family transposase
MRISSLFPSFFLIHAQFFFFFFLQQLAKIYQLNNFLPKLNSLIPWETFRSTLSKVRDKVHAGPGGRPPYDELLMFKILVLKSIYNLADERIEEQIRDRISFQDFLGLKRGDTIPDAKTIWLFAEQLKNLELECQLFDRFNELLDSSGFAVKSGLIVDGSFVEVPKQRNTKDENEQIKKGEIPETLSKNPHVLSQKDCDARWAKKGNETHFGYKDHAVVDEEYKFIRDYEVTDASVHDSQPYLKVMPMESAYLDQETFADSAYVGEKIDTELKKRGFLPMICEKGYRNKPLTDEQKKFNKVKSSVRCRVEHVFGAMKSRCRDEVLRTIGIGRAKFWIGMKNLTYNMGRFLSLKRPKKVPKVA